MQLLAILYLLSYICTMETGKHTIIHAMLHGNAYDCSRHMGKVVSLVDCYDDMEPPEDQILFQACNGFTEEEEKVEWVGQYSEYVIPFKLIQECNDNISIEEFDEIRFKNFSEEVHLMVFDVTDETGERKTVVRVQKPWMPTQDEYFEMLVDGEKLLNHIDEANGITPQERKEKEEALMREHATPEDYETWKKGEEKYLKWKLKHGYPEFCVYTEEELKRFSSSSE